MGQRESDHIKVNGYVGKWDEYDEGTWRDWTSVEGPEGGWKEKEVVWGPGKRNMEKVSKSKNKRAVQERRQRIKRR